MARRICSPACPVSSSTCACSSLHTSAIGNGTCTSNSCPRTTSNLGLDLWSLLWYLFLTAALSFKKGFSTRTLSEFGREPLLLLLKFQLKAGHPLRQCDSAYKARTSQTTKQIITRVPIKPYPNIVASIYPILTRKVREGLATGRLQ